MATGKKPKTSRQGVLEYGTDSKARSGFASDRALQELLSESMLSSVEQALSQTLEERVDIYTHELLSQLEASGIGKVSGAAQTQNESDSKWIAIESLSSLRNLVGGRFHNLKEKWIEAGFPLREHRGDKAGEVEVKKQGWIELTNWILKQGYEARLAPDREDCLFELRPLEK